ncbi:MAG: cytochrome c class [Proteobacteria bacterium]|nr:cytochrome c class [Pseudomonadota bacterium]
MKLFLAMASALLAAGAAATPDELEAGRAIYNFRCYFCHGYSGDGKTLAASYLAPRPTDFTTADPARLSSEKIVATLHRGRAGTAMQSFAGLISEAEMRAVAAFVIDEFIQRKALNTHYHTAANGWPEHQRYRAAFPFAKGEIPLSRPWESLSPEESAGKRLYLASCVTCHDRGAPTADEITWDSRALSFPRNNFSLANAPKPDAIASASPYAKHDIAPRIAAMNPLERRGERLFQHNCAFCHGADGSGQNWIGKFMEPHPRDLRDIGFMSRASRQSIRQAIREGLPNTSMPAWKSVLSERDIQSLLAYISRAFYPLADEKR